MAAGRFSVNSRSTDGKCPRYLSLDGIVSNFEYVIKTRDRLLSPCHISGSLKGMSIKTALTPRQLSTFNSYYCT